jgi:threonine dehydratase
VIERCLSDVATVTEEVVGEAMILLLERSNLVVGGAGAASIAALLSGAITPAADGTTVAILTGGNVDIAVVAEIAGHQGRRIRVSWFLVTRRADRGSAVADDPRPLARAASSGWRAFSLASD